MRKLLCFLGFHKWSFESKTISKHKRDKSEDLITDFVYGNSKFYQYECECCNKKQWYSENYNAFSGFSKRKLNTKKEL